MELSGKVGMILDAQEYSKLEITQKSLERTYFNKVIQFLF
jgi:hypothetical protein